MVELINQGVYLLNGTHVVKGDSGMPSPTRLAKTLSLTRFSALMMLTEAKARKCVFASMQ